MLFVIVNIIAAAVAFVVVVVIVKDDQHTSPTPAHQNLCVNKRQQCVMTEHACMQCATKLHLHKPTLNRANPKHRLNKKEKKIQKSQNRKQKGKLILNRVTEKFS